MPGALDGLLVVDLTSFLSGPYCTMMLADQGADIIKVEPPRTGDSARNMPPFVNGEGAPFMIWNRNKRSVCLDLKSEDDRAKLLTLIDKADILVENYRPGAMERLGLGWSQVSQRNPRLIYGSISGFGQYGPYSHRGGFDLMAQGMSGLMSICGPKDGPPHRLPIPISDINAGMLLAFGILTALEARHKTGKGQYVETSLLEAAASLAVYEAAHFFATDEKPQRLGQSHRGSAPYQAFATQDGYITFGASQQRFFEELCRIIGSPDLIGDPRYGTNADRVRNNEALVTAIQEKLREKPTDFWLAQLDKARIPSGPVLTYDQVFADPQIHARDMVVTTDHPSTGKFRTLGIPVKLSDTPGQIRRPAPTLGEHTDEVLNG